MYGRHTTRANPGKYTVKKKKLLRDFVGLDESFGRVSRRR